jgi:TPR repeat protein/Na+-translocating ferredoxin:NAD+ oxidoreductase RnfD subunit
VPVAVREQPSAAATAAYSSPVAATWWERFPALPMVLAAALGCYALFPTVRANGRLTWTFIGLAAGLLVWELILLAMARRRGLVFRVEFVPVKSHYVQAAVQFGIFVWWGWFAREVYAEAPLILAQVIYLYALEALVTWSRGRTWRLGFGPLPIIFSTNLLLWFKPDWYYYQFLMVTLGALAKQFITWERDGRRTHVFNPSAFGQVLLAIALIVTGTSNELTWGKQIAATFDAPHMLIVLFLGGLVVQYLFHVTLMTFAAAAAICLFNLAYFQFVGTYYFVNTNFAAPIFLGIHLLVTDPATSPKTHPGRVVFGALYGLAYCILFRVLDMYGVPTFWDKLLPVPLLNLCVPWLTRVTRAGWLGRLSGRWEGALQARPLNLVHMGCWSAMFVAMVATGYVEAPHPGASIPFWKSAHAQGKAFAGSSLVMAAGAQAEAAQSGAAWNELGLICMEGQIVRENHAAAARHFARACELGNINGCANVAIQFLFLGERRSDADVARALDQLEAACGREADWSICFLVGVAYETGRGRPRDPDRAIALYERCGAGNLYAAKALARIALSTDVAMSNPPGGESVAATNGTSADAGYDLIAVAAVLRAAVTRGDPEACWYLAYMHEAGRGVPRDPQAARRLVEAACQFGFDGACRAMKQPALPPFANPRMTVPGWSTAFPIE